VFKHFFRKLCVTATILSVAFLFAPGRVLAATSLATMKSAPASVQKMAKFEMAFTISRPFAADSFLPYYFYDAADTPAAYPNRQSPYGVDGITINAVFTSPTGKVETVPAFYYQDFTRTQSGNGDEVMAASSNYDWRVRFTPEEVGNYSYYLTIQDKDGQTRYPATGTQALQVTNSSLKGFLRVSPKDSRFLSLSTGEDFVPIASGHQWPSTNGRSYEYENLFNTYGQNGINFLRIWTQNDGYNLTVEGHFDHYKWPDDFNPEGTAGFASIPKGSQMNQRGGYEFDKIAEAAEKNGIYMIWNSHEDPYWIWDVPRTDYTNPLYLKYWERNYRYRIARWGYSTSVGVIEHWNEEGHIPSGSTQWNWYQTLSAYVKSIDPYHHLFNTSQGSQAYSPAFFSNSMMDITSYHDYLMSSRYSADLFGDEANFLYKAAQCLRFPGTTGCFMGDGSKWTGAQKPIYWGEFDSSGPNWNDPGTPNPLVAHNGLWAGLFSVAGSSPIDWFWQQQNYLPQKYADRKVASNFFKDINYASSQFVFIATSDLNLLGGTQITASNAKMRVMVMRGTPAQQAYAWVQHKDSTWQKPAVTTPISGTFVIPGMSAGSYTVETWDTTSGATSQASATAGSDGNLTITVNNLSKDVALKIRSGSYTPPTTAPTTAPSPIPSPTPSPVVTPSPATQATCNADIDGNGLVDISDYSLWSQNFLKFPIVLPRADINHDNSVDISDYSLWKSSFFMTCTPVAVASPTPTPKATPTPTPQVTPTPVASPTPSPVATPTSIPQTQAGEWTQFAQNAQHTNYTTQSVPTPWKFKWEWNGAGADGKKQAGHITVAKFVEPITGGGRVYMVAGDQVYALNKANGAVLWQKGSIGTLSSTPIYNSEFLYVASGDGNLYKLNAATGAVAAQFKTPGAITVAPTLANGKIYTIGSTGAVDSIDPSNMSKVWEFGTSSPGATPISYSTSKNLLVVITQDLNVHALDASSGVEKWKTKPTPRTYQSGDPTSTGAQAEGGWPVIAEGHGIVFVRYRLDWDTIWTFGTFPDNLADIRANLTGRVDQQALFALKLDDGKPAFVPLAGNGGQGDGGYLPMGPQPVIRVTPDGKEVAYIIWRNKQACGTGWCDAREDANMGEMVLDNTTVSGYQAGDVRFVRNPDIQTDEMMNLSMSNDILFHSHWLINTAEQVTDRSAGLGATIANPIKTVDAPFVIWRQVYCAPGTTCNPQLFPGGSGNSYGPSNCPFNAVTRYCSAGLYSYGDQRGYPAGFYEYWNDNNDGSTPLTTVSDGMVLVKTTDGGLVVLENGNPGSTAVLPNPVTQTRVLGAEDTQPITINWQDASKHVGEKVRVTGVIASAVSHLPKADYLGFTNPHDGHLLVRIFNKDLSKFFYDPLTLKNKKITVTGTVSLYWPDGKDPEIIVTEPSQIEYLP